MEAQTAIPCPDRNFRILTEINANMAMLRYGGDLEVTGFLTIDHVTIHPSRTTPIDFILVILIVLGLIEVLWLSEDRYKILTIFRTSSFNAGEYIDHKIQI